MANILISVIISILIILVTVSAHRKDVLERAATRARTFREIEQKKRSQELYEKYYSDRIKGLTSPYIGLTNPRPGKKETDWLMGYDGSPFGLEMLMIIALPILTAKIFSLLASCVRPLPPDMNKAPPLPKIPIYYLQSTPVERELRRPLRSGIVWHARRFIVRADDDFVDREHIRHLLKTHQKIYADASKNPWHTVRVLLRLNQLKSKSKSLGSRAEHEKPDQLQSFLDRFAKTMYLNDMHKAEEQENLKRLKAAHKASGIKLQNKLVQVKAKQHLETTQEVAQHLDSKEVAMYDLRNKAILAQKRKLAEAKKQLRRQEKMLKWEKKQAAKEENRRVAMLTEEGRAKLALNLDADDSSSSDSDSDSDDDNDSKSKKKSTEHAAKHSHVPTPVPTPKPTPKPSQPLHFSRSAKPKQPYVRQDRSKYDPVKAGWKPPTKIHGVYRAEPK